MFNGPLGLLNTLIDIKVIRKQKMEFDSNEVSTPSSTSELENASRGDRLGAAIIDGLIMMLIMFPVMYLTGGFDGFSDGVQPTLTYSLILSGFGMVVFVLINGKLLATKGQTIGKRALGIKIVTLSGTLPDIKQHLLKRYGFYFLIGYVPFIGQLLSTANVLIIFGKEKRCGHDYVAGTAVVKC